MNYSKFHFPLRGLFAFVGFLFLGNIVAAQDKSIQNLQSDASKEIKKQKIDSGKIWKTGGIFNLNLSQT